MEELPIPFGFVKAGKIYLSSWGNLKDREIGEVREDDIEKSVQFFNDRFNELELKVNELIQKIDSTENKGSFLMKLIHLKDLLPSHDGLGDYPSLEEKLLKNESLIRDIINKNRLRNAEIKRGLILEAKEVPNIINWKEATENVNDLKARWIKTGTADEEHQDRLEEEFWEIVKKFFDRKKQFYEDKQRLTDRRIEQYEELVAQAEKLEGLYGRKRFEKIKDLKQDWKELGGIPAEFYKPLHERFNKVINRKPKIPQSVDYSPILTMLEDVKKGKAPYNKKELDLIKKNLLSDKRRSDDKRKALDLIQLITEKEFVLSLTHRRFPDFGKMDLEKKKKVKANIVKDLINRDTEELKTYEENSANFSSSDGSLNRLVSSKIYNQKKKILLKEQLLEMIKEGSF